MASIKSDKEWANAVRKAVHEMREDPEGSPEKIRAINLLAKTLVAAAIKGDMAAMKEIGDRLDGKPKQAVEQTGEGGGPILVTIGFE